MSSEIKQLRVKAYTVLFSGLFGLLLFLLLLNEFLPPELFGVPKFHVIGLVMVVSWLIYITKAIPRCPKCGMGLFSVLEIRHVPVIVKSWIGPRCSGCGANLQDET